MEHKYKEFLMLKSAEDDDSGKISGYFSTYDREQDAYGDVIAPGAFADTIKQRKESGHPFPLCWNHDLNQIIGSIDPDDIKDTEKGPLMTASFFDTPLAQEKREIVKSGVVYQFSFAYDIREAGEVELEDGTKAYELRKLDLFEVSIVPIPANQNAVMTDIKSGKRNSQKDEDTIKEAISGLEAAIAALKSLLDAKDEGEDDPEDNPEGKDPKGGNPEIEALLERTKEILRRNEK